MGQTPDYQIKVVFSFGHRPIYCNFNLLMAVNLYKYKKWIHPLLEKNFFNTSKTKDTTLFPQLSVINESDKNLMFTNAGMNQFRNIFLGNQESKFSRVANSQKCFRVSGKHNDLEEVGVDTYHHTFFEMLGNWSFDNYFKKEIIDWSFDLITNIYGIKKEDIYVSVFKGSKEDNLEFDKEAFDEWKSFLAKKGS